ncbi:MAG: 3-hydroxyacyl-CoA dehydrogenase family protein, partial [Solirubrobacteraceae bacterium]
DALRTLAPGQGGPEIAVEGLGGTVSGEPFYAIVPLALVEVTGEAGEQTFRGLGLHTERVQPAAAGVLARIVCQVINESAFALGEGVGSADDIDTGMMLGLSHPRGPFAWMREIGPAHVLNTLEALGDEYREERYRPAPALRRLAAEAG